MVADADPYQIIYKPQALADIEDIRAFIAKDSQSQADRYALYLLKEVEGIAKYPTIFRVIESRKNPTMSVRFKPVDSYLIYFRTDENQRKMTVLRIMHGARRQPRRFR